MKTIQSSAGFTLVELITVILILGILAATALPKFIDVTDNAKIAAHEGVGGSFGSAVALAHAQWVANGANATAAAIAGYGSSAGDVWANTSGWPVDDGSATLNCTDLWDNLMQNPPEISATSTNGYTVTAASPDCNYKQNSTASYTTGGTQGEIDYESDTGVVIITHAVKP